MNLKIKKSQMQIGETVAVIAVFFIIAIISAAFYFNASKSNIIREIDEAAASSSVGIVQKILSLPEIQCSQNNVVQSNCVDKIKLENVYSLMLSPDNKLAYFYLFGYSNIEIIQVYPSQTSTKIYSNNLDKFRSSIQTNLPVTIYDPVSNTNSFGYVSVTTYTN